MSAAPFALCSNVERQYNRSVPEDDQAEDRASPRLVVQSALTCPVCGATYSVVRLFTHFRSHTCGHCRTTLTLSPTSIQKSGRCIGRTVGIFSAVGLVLVGLKLITLQYALLFVFLLGALCAYVCWRRHGEMIVKSKEGPAASRNRDSL